jgi:hypothetical protein
MIGLVILAFIINQIFAVYGVIAMSGKHDTMTNLIEPFSVAMFQQQLKDAGYYKGDIDGKLGPHTQASWDRWYCDSKAAKNIERNEQCGN